MELTVYSIIMTILWSSLLIFLYSFLQRNHRFLDLFSVSSVILLYLFCMIRMFVPIEFPWVMIVYSEQIMNHLHEILYTDVISVRNIIIDVSHVLLCIWIVVSMFLLIKLAYSYFCMNRRIEQLSCKKEKEFDDILREIEKEEKLLKVEVVKCSGIDAPFGAGIIRKKILIPDYTYSRKELFFIIRHEYMHLKNQDLLVQLLVNILCALYWWNPFVYLLRRNMEYNFEIRCDQMVVQGMDYNAVADYMETVLKVFKTKKMYNKNLKHAMSMTGILRSNREDIKDRFDILLRESDPCYKTYGKQIAVFMIVVIWILSYSFIFQPNILPTADDMEINNEDIYELNINENYILHYKNDTYKLITFNGDEYEIEKNAAEQMERNGFEVREELEAEK